MPRCLATAPRALLWGLVLAVSLAAGPVQAQGPGAASAPTPPPAVVAPPASDSPTAPETDEGPRLSPGEELPWTGGAIPRSARLVEVPRTALFVTGFVAGSLAWAPFAFAGISTMFFGVLAPGVSGLMEGRGLLMLPVGLALFLPIVGPLMTSIAFLGIVGRPGSPGWDFEAFVVADLVLQAGGLALALWAHFHPRQVLRGYASPMEGAVSWALLPGAGGSPSGATFVMRF